MAMTLRLDDDVNDALRERAAFERRSMQELVSDAVVEYIERHSRADLLDQVLDSELPRYAEALSRLGE
jgi:predicted transcriptional regulator